MSSTDAIAALLEQRHQAWAARDVSRFAALYAEDCTVETQIAGTIKGRAAVAAKESELFAMFPDVATEIEETTIMGNRAFVTGTVSGTDEGGAFAPPGTHVRFPMVLMCTVADGKIVSERRIWDFRGFLLDRVAGRSQDGREDPADAPPAGPLHAPRVRDGRGVTAVQGDRRRLLRLLRLA